MWEERARRARRDVVALASSGLGVSDLHAAAIGVMAEASAAISPAGPPSTRRRW